jgi:hypothetical protein
LRGGVGAGRGGRGACFRISIFRQVIGIRHPEVVKLMLKKAKDKGLSDTGKADVLTHSETLLIPMLTLYRREKSTSLRWSLG